MTWLVRKEEVLFEWLIDRAWAKYGPDSRDGWENWLMNHWPSKLTIGYWYYIFCKLEKGHWGGYEANRWLNLSRISEVRLRRWWPLTEETKIERIICRFRGHPNGEVYYSSGDEPDHHCKDCGENIG